MVRSASFCRTMYSHIKTAGVKHWTLIFNSTRNWVKMGEDYK